MGTMQVLDAERMLEIEAESVVGGSVNNAGHLILTRHDGSTIDAGDVSVWLPGRLKAANNLGVGNDPNSFTDSGWYAGTNWAASLLGYTYGVVEVFAYDANYIVQNFWIAGTTPRRLNRAKVAGTWTSWVEKDSSATTSLAGEVELATSAESITGTDGTRAVTPAGLSSVFIAMGKTALATVDPAWNGRGNAPIIFSDLTTSTAKIPRGNNSFVVGGAPVKVRSINGVWYIDDGYQEEVTYPRLWDLRPYLNPALVRAYNESNPADTTGYPPFAAWRLISGEVMFTGLLNPLTSTATNLLWLTLPVELRPLGTVYMYAEYGGANAVRVQINTDGTVYVGGTTGYSLNTYIDFSNIRYNNNPSLARTPMVLNSASGWVPYSATDFTPRYVADDGYGRKFWEGIAKGGAPGTNIALASANPGLVNTTASQQHLFFTPEATGFSRMDITTNLYRNGTPANPNGPSDKMSLHHSILTDAAYNSALGVYYANGGNYGGGWAQFVVKKLADGAIKTSGLAVATASGNWVRIPMNFAPKYKMLFVTVGTDNPARIDINPDGWVGFTAGTGTFIGMDDFEWMPAEAWDRAWAKL